ncbi:MAG: porin family protein [Bacteroidales bacterium]
MKRNLVITIVMVFLSTLPFYGQKLRLGVTAGLNVSTLSEPGNLYNNEALKTGFGGGLEVKYAFNETFGVRTGVLYEQKGFRKNKELFNQDEKITGMYHYLNVPLLIEGTLSVTGDTRLYGVTGLYTGFRCYSENTLTLEGTELLTAPEDEDINKTEYGWTFGGGIQMSAGKHLMQIGFRYSLGLTEVLESQPEDHNKSVLVGVTLLF